MALPTNSSTLEIFETTITGGFTCVNTRLSFDTEILMPNFKKSAYDNMMVDKIFTAFKKVDVKVIYKIKLDGEKANEIRRIISKILKLDENNQYGFAMKNLCRQNTLKNIHHPLRKKIY